MRIDVDEGSDRDPAELEQIDRDGAWFIVFANPDATTAGIVPFVVHGCESMQGCDLMAGAMAKHYPDRAVYAIGLSRGESVQQARVLMHTPDDDQWPGPPEGEGNEAIKAARAHLDIYRRSELRKRDAMVRAESAKVPPAPAAGPDLDDHLYRDKVIPIVGTPAAERAANGDDVPEHEQTRRVTIMGKDRAREEADGEGGGR